MNAVNIARKCTNKIITDAATNDQPPEEYISAGNAFCYFNGTELNALSTGDCVCAQEMVAVETEEYAQHCKWMHKWYEAGYIPPDCITTSKSTQDILNAQNWVVCINSERPEKAFQFLNLLYEDADILNVLYYGLEGTHYEKAERSGFINLRNGADFTTSAWGYNLGLYGAVAKIYQYDDPSYPDDYFEQLAKFDELNPEDGFISPYLGYAFVSEQYKTEVAAVNDIITQYRTALEVGAVDPEVTLPQFNEALKAAGIKTIIEGNQKDLDEWLAAR